jgi:hypothetical protein
MAELSLNRLSEGIFQILLELNGPKAIGHDVPGCWKTKAELKAD